MPDFFVPIDTTQYTDYHRNLVAKGVVIKATTGYIEKHRKELQNKYKKFEAFNEKFEIDDNFLAEIRTLADKEKSSLTRNSTTNPYRSSRHNLKP